jgi:hypothetical protein
MEKLHNEINIFRPRLLHRIQINEDEMCWTCSTIITDVYRILVGKHDGRQLGKPRRSWKNNTETYLKKNTMW